MLFIFLQFYFHMCCIWTYCLWPFWLLFDLTNGLSHLALYSYSWRVSCFLLFLVSERFPCPIFHLHHNRGRRIIPFSTAHRIFTKARWLGFSANIFLTNLGSFFWSTAIHMNLHSPAQSCAGWGTFWSTPSPTFSPSHSSSDLHFHTFMVTANLPSTAGRYCQPCSSSPVFKLRSPQPVGFLKKKECDLVKNS